MPNYGHLSLSCAKIERPSPLKKTSCKVRFFANRHFRNYRQKVTATTLFQTASYSDFQLLAQMAHVCLHSESGYTLGFRRKIAHNGSHGETRGVSDGAAVTTLDTFRTFANLPGPGIRTAYFASFGAWSGVLPKNAGSLGTAMRLCVSLFRGVAAPLGCVIFSVSVEIAACMPCAQGLSVCTRRGVVSLPSVRFTCC